MKFIEIFRFELKYQLGRYLTWIFFLAVLILAALSSWSMFDNIEKGEYFMNSPVIIAILTAVSSMFCLLLTAAVSGNAAVRDIQAGMEPLLYTTSMKKYTFLGGRLLASFIIGLMVLIIVQTLIFISSLIPLFDNYFMPNDLNAYLRAFILIAVPNILVTTSILFSLALVSRRAMTSFLGAALLFFISLMSMDIIAGELGLWEWGKRLDMSGMTVIRELRYLFTPLEMPVNQIPFRGSLSENRFIWLGVGFLFFGIAYLRFKFIHHTSQSSQRKRAVALNEEENTGIKWNTPVFVPDVRRVFNLNTSWQQVGYLTVRSFKEMLRGKVWLLLVGVLIIVGISAEEVMEGQLGVSIVPTTWRTLQMMEMLGVGMTIALLITYFSGELIWRDRDQRVDEITDVSPVPDWVLFLSKFLGLVLLLLMFQGIILVSGILIQASQEFYEFDIWLYIRVLFGFRLVDLLLFTVVAFFIHTLVNQKYLGYLVIFLAYFYMYFPGMLGLQHKLLIFGAAPSWSYSEISGFEPYVGPWLWFKLLWIVWALLLAFLVHLFWNRGKELRWSRKLSRLQTKSAGVTARAGIPAVLALFIISSFIFYNTNILNDYITPKERVSLQALYEKTYGKYKGVPQPLLSAVKLKGEIFPRERKVEISGNYTLVNRSSVDIDTVHFSTNRGVNTKDIRFSRNAVTLIKDDKLGHHIYKFGEALKPGDSINVEFTAIFSQSGFSNNGIGRGVVGNGTYLGYHYMPEVGYEVDREIDDEKLRKKHGLPARPAIPLVNDLAARMNPAGNEKIDFEAILGTSEDQIAVTAGTLQRSWIKNGRRYFHYVADVPITHNYEIFSAKYDVYKTNWKDVQIEIHHHPTHTRNLDRMVKGVKASLDYFEKNLSSYPHRQIRIVEYPGSGVGLNGNPVTMSYSEDFSLYAPEKDHLEIDFPFAVIAHEVSHQWWGNEIRPAMVEGSPVLTESLAWYTAMMVYEETFGTEDLKLLLRVMRQQYLNPRSAADVPLLRSTDKFNVYRKGPFAMYAVKEYIGEEKVNSALRELLGKFANVQTPLPVSMDLYRELQEVTPDSLQYLLKDLFERNTFWELEAVEADAKLKDNGTWNLAYNFKTRKVEVDETGVETEHPMNDFIEIGIYANSPEGGLGEVLYLKKHKLKAGEQTIHILLPKQPDLVGIDPNRLLIDRNIGDNFVKVGEKANETRKE